VTYKCAAVNISKKLAYQLFNTKCVLSGRQSISFIRENLRAIHLVASEIDLVVCLEASANEAVATE